MLLGRLRIRAKLALLVIIPLLAVGALTIPVVLERVALADRAGDTALSVRVASQVGSLAQDLQRERLLAVGFLVGAVDRNRLVLQMSAVTDRITDVRFDLADELPAEVDDAIDGVKALADLRVAVLGRVGVDDPGDDRLRHGDQPADRIVAAGRRRRRGHRRGPPGRRAGRAAARRRGEQRRRGVPRAAGRRAIGRAGRPVHHPAGGALRRGRAVHARWRRPTQISLYQLVAEAFTERLGTGFVADPLRQIAAFPVAALFPSLESFIALGNFVEKRIVADVTAAVGARERRALITAYSVVGGAIVDPAARDHAGRVGRAGRRPAADAG